MGEFTKRQMAAHHMTAAVYSAVVFGNGGEVLARSTFQLGLPAPGVGVGY
jgi:hypothetical protein